MSEEIGMAASRQAKHDQLLDIDRQLTEIYQHIDDLNRRLGVNPISEVPKQTTAPEPAQDLGSLVAVLNTLPSMTTMKVSEIHRLLNDLEENLI